MLYNKINAVFISVIRNLSTIYNEQYAVGYARTNVIGSGTSFVTFFSVLAYIEIYVFRGNPFQAHSLEQS